MDENVINEEKPTMIPESIDQCVKNMIALLEFGETLHQTPISANLLLHQRVLYLILK